MERILYFDCFSGASGDMCLGACVDAGLPVEHLQDTLGALALEGVSLEVRRVVRAGIAATKVTVLDTSRPAGAAGGGQAPGPRSPGRRHGHATGHRHLPDILRLLAASTLTAPVRERAATLFRRLAEAEAAVHGIPVERVHFHEVGALDSIVDIVGAASALEWFGADRIVASPLNTGSGTVRCAHGTMPVPAPATAQLLAGVPIHAAGPAVELLTPTGALLMTQYASSYGALPEMSIERIGYGAGHLDFPDWPNVLRLIVGTAASREAAGPGRAAIGPTIEPLVVLECEVDDLNPQVLGALMPRLLAEGARDVYYTGVQMKKCRPGTLVTVLSAPGRVESLLDILFGETTTLGVRMHEVVRETLVRELVAVDTPYGRVRVKVARRRGRIVSAAPEFDDCARLAAVGAVPVKEVIAAASAAWRGHALEAGRHARAGPLGGAGDAGRASLGPTHPGS